MLVLSRKVDQQITIGDDITLTVVRVDGNRVRIGISAPRDVRILRGELAAEEPVEFELSDRELAFAHPPEQANGEVSIEPNSDTAESQVFSGSVSSDGSKVKLSDSSVKEGRKAPLASFVSAS
jgi:carbon storage regulator CsrA